MTQEQKVSPEQIVRERFKGKSAAERQSMIAEYKLAMDKAQVRVDKLKRGR